MYVDDTADLFVAHTHHIHTGTAVPYLLPSPGLNERALGHDLHRVRPCSVQAGDLVAVGEPSLLRQSSAGGENRKERDEKIAQGCTCVCERGEEVYEQVSFLPPGPCTQNGGQA